MLLQTHFSQAYVNPNTNSQQATVLMSKVSAEPPGEVAGVSYLGGEGASFHLLKAQGQHTLGQPSLDEVPGHVQRRGAGGAVVVDIVDGDARHAHLIQGTLATGGVSCNTSTILIHLS